VLGGVGLVGGALLVRWALRAVHEYERNVQERLQELDDFAGRVAHDLRNPLQAMGMALSLIERRTSDERIHATSATAKASVARMSSFIQELLTFARSGARPDPAACARVDGVLREVQQDLSPQAAERRVELSVRAAPGVHAAIAPEALRAIVGNLADNAVKHMAPDGPERRVELSATAAPRSVRITVRDTGPGIDPASLPRVFDPFYRATPRGGGFGIGLKTVKRLVDAHRGSVEVESEVGRGSVFTVTLPEASSPAEEASHPPLPSGERAGVRGSRAPP
jgi:signal transduction histidine kinase